MKHCNKFFLILFAGLFLFIALPHYAAAADVSPFGFTIGKTTSEEVKRYLNNNKDTFQVGIDEYTSGASIITKGESFNVDGLDSVSFIFDENNVLVFTFLMMNKSRFDSILEYLSEKYTLVDNKTSEGDRYAKFIEGDVIIMIDAAFPGSMMQISYITKEFTGKVVAVMKNRAEQKKKREEDLF